MQIVRLNGSLYVGSWGSGYKPAQPPKATLPEEVVQVAAANLWRRFEETGDEEAAAKALALLDKIE